MLKRPFCGMAVGFLLGILAAAYGADVFFCPAVAAVFFYTVCRIRKQASGRATEMGWKKNLFRLWLCMLVFILGRGKFLWEEQFRAEYLPFLENGMQLTVQGKLTGKQMNNDQYIYELTSCMIGPDQNKFLAQEAVPCNRILTYSDADVYSIGQILIVDGTVELWKSASNEGGFDAKAFYEARKTDFKLRDSTVRAAYGKKDGIAERLWKLRLRLKGVYQENMHEQEAGIMTTMVTGDKGLLDAEVKRLYQVGGLSHILAISGLHISLLGMTLYRVLRKSGMGFAGAGILAGSLMYGYGIMAGFGVSVQRSVFMFLVFLVAQIIGRSYDTLNALGAAAVFLLWQNPYLVWDAGFCFSFAAILGVAWVGGSIPAAKEDTGQWKERVFTAAAIQFTTLPLAAWYYYEIPVYAVAVNLIVLPFMGILLGMGVTGGLTGLLSADAARILLFPCQILLGLFEWLCTLTGKLPGAVWITGRPGIWRLLLYYGLLAMVTVCMYKRQRKAAAKEKACGLGMRLCAAGALLLAILCVPENAAFELDVLDVGQGDGSFLRTKEGYAVFVDGGSSDVGKVGEYRILPFLKYKGVRKVDCWIVSHTDEDHISGLKEILEAGYPVRYLVFAEEIVRDTVWEELVALAEKAGTEIIYLEAGDVLSLGDAKFTAVFPVAGEKNADKNETSLVVLYEEDDFTGIFTGDIGDKQEHQIAEWLQKRASACGEVLSVDFYKAAHHGSNNSNSAELLNLLQPEIATISCARKNRYGHPGEEAVAHLKEAGSRVFYTMESGQITIMIEDGGKVYEFAGERRKN